MGTNALKLIEICVKFSNKMLLSLGHANFCLKYFEIVILIWRMSPSERLSVIDKKHLRSRVKEFSDITTRELVRRIRVSSQNHHQQPPLTWLYVKIEQVKNNFFA